MISALRATYAHGCHQRQSRKRAAGQVDATGAGDAFTAGLLHGLLQGEDMVKALQAGAAWGAAAVARLRSIPVPWEELAGPFR